MIKQAQRRTATETATETTVLILMTSSDAVTSVFHDSLYLSNLLVKRIDLKLCVSQNLKKNAVSNYSSSV